MSGDFKLTKRTAQVAGDIAVSLEGKLSKTCEALLTHIVSTRWPDGSDRETSSLSLFFSEGVLKACLNDRSQGLVAFVSGGSLEALLAALEKGLREDTLDWRPDRASAAARRKK